MTSSDGKDRRADFDFAALFRSDSLRELRGLLLQMPAFREFLPALFQIRVIIDANIVQGELRWRLAKRDKPEARSGLHESIVSGVMVVFAPLFLRKEIEEHIEEIARETGKTVSQAMEEWRELQTHLRFYQPTEPMSAVIGTKDILRELRWRLSQGRNPGHCSGFQDAIDSGVILRSPVSVRADVESHIDEIARQIGVQTTQVMDLWLEIQTHLKFYEPGSSDTTASEIADLDDLPYKRAYHELAAAAVYSRDPHLQEMGVPAVRMSIDLTLRNHARSSSVVVHFAIGTTMSGVVGLTVLQAMFDAFRGVIAAFRRLPSAVQLCFAAIAVALPFHPKVRAKILDFFRSLYQQALDAKPILLPVVCDLATQLFAEMASASETRKLIETTVPAAKKRKAIVHVRTICLMSGHPLSVAEIEQRMRDDGYVSRSTNFGAYLRRLLRASAQFVEISPGMWIMQPVQVSDSAA